MIDHFRECIQILRNERINDRFSDKFEIDFFIATMLKIYHYLMQLSDFQCHKRFCSQASNWNSINIKFS